MSRRPTTREQRELRVCIRCRVVSFDPASRDVSDWLVIDDLDASDHCRGCWTELSKTRGRPLGKPCAQIPFKTSWAA